MKIALLCPGPSLAQYTGTDAELIIGINRVALSIPCDVWAANDYPTIRKLHPCVLGTNMALLSRQQTLLDVKDRVWFPHDKFTKLVNVDEIIRRPPLHRWQQLTMLAAMVFALNNNGTQLDIYGCDQAGTKDWDGTEFGEDRTDRRWAEEKEWYEIIAAWMRENGCAVTRMETCNVQ